MGARSQALILNIIHSKFKMIKLVKYSDSNCVYYSYACAIPDEDTGTIIITGGADTLNTVSVYNVEGWQEDLPSLNTGRSSHACSSYMSGERRVR